MSDPRGADHAKLPTRLHNLELKVDESGEGGSTDPRMFYIILNGSEPRGVGMSDDMTLPGSTVFETYGVSLTRSVWGSHPGAGIASQALENAISGGYQSMTPLYEQIFDTGTSGG